MAQDTFRRQVKRRAAVAPSITSVSIDTVDENDEPVGTDVFHFSRPTEEQLFLMAASMGGETSVADEAAAVLDIMRVSLPTEEFRKLRSRLLDPEDGLDMEVLGGTIQDLLSAWSDFPTKPQSASSESQNGSGPKSTGRVRGAGSTHSPSTSPDS